ncbi:MAG: DUF1540 domain-containing protein [Ruminococcaceae bacterium]|nr:DUF1540 domain-containing protein [Oscillospiraceae bacterium]
MSDCKTNNCAKNPNQGISCMVKNCVYHDGEKNCMTKEISVGPHHANSSADTICATFKAKE